MKKAIVIGSGFAGLSSAAYLAKNGMQVTVIEKNNQLGGRARILKTNGYSFDMGPSWYWMPDIFDNFFQDFNTQTKNFYKLTKLDPGFKIIFESEEINIPADFEQTCAIFSKYEKNGGKKLKKFIKDAKKKYKIGTNFIYNAPGISIMELFSKEIILNLTKLNLLSSYRSHIRKYFNHPYLINILEFPVLFLGATADKMPALYSLMAFSAIKQGTYYPSGGFNKIIQSLIKLCRGLDIKFINNESVTKINIKNNQAISVETDKNNIIDTELIIASADYAHVEQNLIPRKYKNYSKTYWEKRKFSPSALIFYLGVNKKINKLIHHNLFFDEDIDNFSKDTYENKIWPKKPLFYVCCPSKTDQGVAPPEKENIFILMPISTGIKDAKETREKYFKFIISKLEKYCKQSIYKDIDYKKSYCITNFQEDYNAYKGNAYGLANILSQTANLKPKIRNRKIKNLFYTGHLTVPGPGVPPSLISGKIVTDYIINQ